MKSYRLGVTILLCAAGSAQAGTIFYSIGAASSGQPGVSVVEIDTGSNSVAPVLSLASDSLSFSGLTYSYADGNYYAVANDSQGNSSLVNFSLAGSGAFTTVGSMSAGGDNPLSFNGGMAYNSQDGYFYAMANSSTGNSFLFRVDQSVPGTVTVTQLTEWLGASFNGGLTYNDADGLLYGLFNDSDGNSTVYSFTISGNTASRNDVFGQNSIGQGFYGGLAFDDNNNLYALASDGFGAGWLNSLDGSGTATSLFTVGNGFLNAGLTEGGPGTGPSTPEPASWTLLATGIGLLVAGVHRRHKK